jgi:hypothetical protein
VTVSGEKIVICELDAAKYGKYVQAYFPEKSLWVGIMLIGPEANQKPEKGIILMKSCEAAKKVCSFISRGELPVCEDESISFSNLEPVDESVDIASVAQRILEYKENSVFEDKKGFVDFIKTNASPETKDKISQLSVENCTIINSDNLSRADLKKIAMSTPDELDSLLSQLVDNECDDEIKAALRALG